MLDHPALSKLLALCLVGATLGLTNNTQPLFGVKARERETSPKSVPFEEQDSINWKSRVEDGFWRDPALFVDCGYPGTVPEKGRLKSKETVHDIQCFDYVFLTFINSKLPFHNLRDLLKNHPNFKL